MASSGRSIVPPDNAAIEVPVSQRDGLLGSSLPNNTHLGATHDTRSARLGMRLAKASSFVSGPGEPPTGREWLAYGIRVGFLDAFGEMQPWWSAQLNGPAVTTSEYCWMLKRHVHGVAECWRSAEHIRASAERPDWRQLLPTVQRAFEPVIAKATPNALGFFLSHLWTLLDDLHWIRAKELELATAGTSTATHHTKGDDADHDFSAILDALHPRDFSPFAIQFPSGPDNAPVPGLVNRYLLSTAAAHATDV